MTGWLVVLAVACGAALLGAVTRRPAGAAPHGSLPVFGSVPAFSLIDQQGRAVTRRELEGQIWIADFIFTSCAGQCLFMSDQMRGLQRAFAEEPALRFVSFSVDPQRDTPEVLSAYAQRHGADARWHLLTGPREALYALSREGFHLAVDDAPDSPREPITHSVRLVLVDRRGRIRGYYDATEAQAMARLREETRRLLQEDR